MYDSDIKCKCTSKICYIKHKLEKLKEAKLGSDQCLHHVCDKCNDLYHILPRSKGCKISSGNFYCLCTKTCDNIDEDFNVEMDIINVKTYNPKKPNYRHDLDGGFKMGVKAGEYEGSYWGTKYGGYDVNDPKRTHYYDDIKDRERLFKSGDVDHGPAYRLGFSISYPKSFDEYYEESYKEMKRYYGASSSDDSSSDDSSGSCYSDSSSDDSSSDE